MLNPAFRQDGGAMPRHRIERAIEALIELLDATEPDPDLEPTGDDEPSLGWTSTMAYGSGNDLEDNCDSGIADLDGVSEQGFLGVALPGGGRFE